MRKEITVSTRLKTGQSAPNNALKTLLMRGFNAEKPWLKGTTVSGMLPGSSCGLHLCSPHPWRWCRGCSSGWAPWSAQSSGLFSLRISRWPLKSSRPRWGWTACRRAARASAVTASCHSLYLARSPRWPARGERRTRRGTSPASGAAFCPGAGMEPPRRVAKCHRWISCDACVPTPRGSPSIILKWK